MPFYLTAPATARRAMKRTKPSHTPWRPKTGAANNKNAEETAPTSIYEAIIKKVNLENHMYHERNIITNSEKYNLPWRKQHIGNQKHHNGDRQKYMPVH